MIRLALSLVAAIAALTGAASARTVLVADLLTEQSAASEHFVINPGDISVYFSTKPLRVFATEDLALAPVQQTAAPAKSRTPASVIEIVASKTFEFSNFRFNVNGGPPAPGKIFVNGVPMSIGDAGALVVSGPVVTLRQPRGQPFQFSLVSFDVKEIEAPLPAAGLLMLAGLLGMGVATLRRKQI